MNGAAIMALASSICRSRRSVGCFRPPASKQTQNDRRPEKLERVQELMAAGDERAQRIFQTLGVYLGYAIAHYAGLL